MPDPSKDLLVQGTSVVTSGTAGARQIEGHVARRYLEEGRTAWLTPTVQTYRNWAADIWSRHLDDGRRQILTDGQVNALWRRVVEASPVGRHGLLEYRHAAVWARQASQRRREWNLGLDELRRFRDDPDSRALIHWEQAYRKALDASGWMDPSDVEDALSAHAGTLPSRSDDHVVWSDSAISPAHARLLQRLRNAGQRHSEWTPPQINRRCRRVQLPEFGDEARTAAAWAAARLARQPLQRIAIVVPELGNRRDEILGIFEDALSPRCSGPAGAEHAGEIVFLQDGPSALENPVIGAALTALELFTRTGDFQVLSRWLRSPFFVSAGGEAESRGMLEAQLRSHISSRLIFREALGVGGLEARIRAALPGLGEMLGEAAALMGSQPRRATPSHWAAVWRQLLSVLEWHGSATRASTAEDWESALNALELLTPILGRMSASDALQELEDILGRSRRRGTPPVYGVFVISDPEDVIPGYDALWVCGLTDTQWPRAPQPVPLLPLALQNAHGMPSAHPNAALERSRLILRRLVEGTGDVVLSSPDVVHDHQAQPSPLILSYPAASEAELIGARRRPAGFGPIDESRMEIVSDPVPPVATRKIRGGIRTLSMHSRCPLRAFMESRLQAVPLEVVRPGLSAAERGVAVHAAAQRLLRELPEMQEIASWSAAERAQRIDRSSRQALSRLFGTARGRLQPLFRLELGRLRSMLAALLEMDLARAKFRVVAVERPMQVTVGGMELSCRIDRIDQLEGGDALAVMDYKTGSRHSPGNWLRERPRDLQLPLYASFIQTEVEAVAIAVLHPRNPRYKGFWTKPEQFPGRSARLPSGATLSGQRKRWRAQLEELATEFAAGDGRIFMGDCDAAGGAFSALTRAHELTALARSTDP